MDAMTGKDAAMKPMTDAPAPPNDAAPQPADTARERLRARRLNDKAASANLAGLDERGLRRTRFLLEHQASDRAGNAPSPQEKSFKFREDES
jgi:hypothetical protein